jgi:ferredoxin
MPEKLEIVEIDYALCAGHGNCHAVAPDAFALDDEGRGVVREGAARASVDDLERAVALCPEAAITLLAVSQ